MGRPIELDQRFRGSFQDAYDSSLHSGFGGDDVTVIFCSQAGNDTSRVGELLRIDSDTIRPLRAPASGALAPQDVRRRLTGQVDLVLGHPDCGGAQLLPGSSHPDRRADKALRRLAGDIGAEYGGLAPLPATPNNVLYVVSKEVPGFDPGRVETLPPGYVLHEHIGERPGTLRSHVQALSGVIESKFPTTGITIVTITNGHRREATGEFATRLRRMTVDNPKVTVVPLVVRRR